MKKHPVALTIAGSDSGGGAGLQADLKTFQRMEVFGTSVVTCLTAQNTAAVLDVFPVPSEFIKKQLDAVFSDFNISAVKTGMLYNKDIINAVSDSILKNSPVNLVVDPVMVATSGDKLLKEDAVTAYKERIFPHTTLLTPNLREASVLTGNSITDIQDMKEAALNISEYGVEAVLIKGGHSQSKNERATDLLYFNGEFKTLKSLVVDEGVEYHGSGCTLSSAITAYIALGYEIPDACEKAKIYIYNSIKKSFAIGRGSNVLNFWV